MNFATLHFRYHPPSAQIEPERLTVAQGSTAELRCDARGDPVPTVRWTKVSGELGRNAEVFGSSLRLSDVSMHDRGIYICIAESAGGSAQATSMLEVERREAPVIELYPKANQTVVEGGSVILQCRITRGDPAPTIRWTKSDNRPFGPNIEELPHGALRCVTRVIRRPRKQT